MIDISEVSDKKCFKYPQKLTGNLKIVYNATSSMLCLWNKHHIFIHESLYVEDTAKCITPEFPVKDVCLVSNYLLYLDYNNNLYQISLKFKHSTSKRFKHNFQIRDQNILTINNLNDTLISLKCEDNTFFISAYKIEPDFHLLEKLILSKEYAKEIKPIIYTYELTEMEFETLKEVFNNKGPWCSHYLVLINFDKTVFACLFSLQNSYNQDFKLVQLYACPTDIADIKIVNRSCLDIIIALSTGTLICLVLNNEKQCSIIHLNTSITKILNFNDSVIYTDGSTLWKADFPFKDIKFKQFCVKQVKDIAKYREKIICTTYSNFIYILGVEDESCYIKPVLRDEYCSIEHLLNNTDYYNRILKEVEKLEVLAKKTNKEKNYITILALSNKQEVMDSILSYDFTVFDSYEDILSLEKTLIFTEDLNDMFDKETFYIMVSITSSQVQQHFKEIFSNLFGDLRIHITVSTNEKVIKTNTIKIDELNNNNIIVTLKNTFLDLTKRLFLNIQLITEIPGVLDDNKIIWTCLHDKNIELRSDHFIKTYKKSNNIYLKQDVKDISDPILETAIKQFDTLFKITKRIGNTFPNDWLIYMKLPNNYKEIFKNVDFFKKFPTTKRKYLKEQISEAFINSKTTLQLITGSERTELDIINDGFSNPILKVSSSNAKVALDIRNLFSDLIYKDFSNLDIHINWSLYTTLETYQREIKKFLEGREGAEDFLDLHDTFNRKIIANLLI